MLLEQDPCCIVLPQDLCQCVPCRSSTKRVSDTCQKTKKNIQRHQIMEAECTIGIVDSGDRLSTAKWFFWTSSLPIRRNSNDSISLQLPNDQWKDARLPKTQKLCITSFFSFFCFTQWPAPIPMGAMARMIQHLVLVVVFVLQQQPLLVLLVVVVVTVVVLVVVLLYVGGVRVA